MMKDKFINSSPTKVEKEIKFWNFVEGQIPELILYGEIAQRSWWGDEVTHGRFANDLVALGDVSEIVVRINSGGGDVFAANAIYCLLKDHKAKITVKIDGWAASAATVIAMAGDIVEIPASAIFMVHDPKTVLYGAYSKEECETQAKSIETVKKSLLESYVSKTGKSHEELSQIMANETWYTGQEAVEAGFCDRVSIQGNSILNYAGLDPSNHRNFPVRLMNLYTASANSILPPQELGQQENMKLENKKEGTAMDLESLKMKYPELVAQIQAEAVTDERKRIQTIDEIAMDGYEAEATKAKFETGASPETYAMNVQRIMKADGNAYLAHAKDDSITGNVNGIKPIQNNQAAETENEATATFRQMMAKQKGV